VAGSTYHRGPRSSCKWRRAPEDEVTTLFWNVARQSPSDAAPHHRRMETSQLQHCGNKKSRNLLKVSHSHIAYYYALDVYSEALISFWVTKLRICMNS
jgi:hypothetical protein